MRFTVTARGEIAFSYEIEAPDIHHAGASSLNLLTFRELVEKEYVNLAENLIDIFAVQVSGTDGSTYRGSIEDCIGKIRADKIQGRSSQAGEK